MSDTISIRGIRARGHHGVLDFEREHGQVFVVDVEMTVDTARAAAHDDLTLTVDYGAVAHEVTRIVSGPPFDLIETLADRVAAAVRAFERVQRVTVTVHKPHAPVPAVFDDVVVRITR